MPASYNCPNDIKNLFNFGNRCAVLASLGMSCWGSNPVWVDWMREPSGRTTDALLPKVGDTLVRKELACCADSEAQCAVQPESAISLGELECLAVK